MSVKKESTTKAKKTTTKKVEAKNTAPKEFETLYTQDIPDLDITDNESYLQGISVVRKRHEKTKISTKCGNSSRRNSTLTEYKLRGK